MLFDLQAATNKARSKTGDKHIGTQVARGLVDVVRSPAYATGVGLVMFGAQRLRSPVLSARQQADAGPGVFRRAWSRLAEMF